MSPAAPPVQQQQYTSPQQQYTNPSGKTRTIHSFPPVFRIMFLHKSQKILGRYLLSLCVFASIRVTLLLFLCFFPTKSFVFFLAVQTSYEASSAVSVSLDAGSQQSGPYVVDHDDSTQQDSGILRWFSGSNFMNKVVEKTKVNELVTCTGLVSVV